MIAQPSSPMFVGSAQAVAEASQRFNRVAEKLQTLWSMPQEWDALLGQLAQPEVYPPEEIQAELDRLAGDIRHKAQGIATVIQALDNLADAQEADEKRMAAKKKQTRAHAERLRAYALACMDALGTERIETGRFTLSVRQNPPACTVLDAAAIPGEYQRTVITTSVDKLGILRDFKASGVIPPGVDVTRGTRLEIS